MLFNTLLLAGVAAAAPALNARQAATELSPWEITFASSGRPSGRPGSSPNSTLQINIKDPNNIPTQRVPGGQSYLPSFEASCSWSWPTAGDFPAGVETLCSTVGDGHASTYGNFTMTLSGEAQADFSVAIKETREVTIFQQRYVRVFEGEQEFKLGGDFWRQTCGGSGVCSWQVKDGGLPIKVEQELTLSLGSCEESTVGGC